MTVVEATRPRRSNSLFPSERMDHGGSQLPNLAVAREILVFCGHHQAQGRALVRERHGRLFLRPEARFPCCAKETDSRLGVVGNPCGCIGDWGLLTGELLSSIRSRFGRVPDRVVERVARRALRSGRSILDVLDVVAEVHEWDPPGGWAGALGVVELYGSLAGLELAAANTRPPPEFVLSSAARRDGRRVARQSNP